MEILTAAVMIIFAMIIIQHLHMKQLERDFNHAWWKVWRHIERLQEDKEDKIDLSNAIYDDED